jgi:hypothetical protein
LRRNPHLTLYQQSLSDVRRLTKALTRMVAAGHAAYEAKPSNGVSRARLRRALLAAQRDLDRVNR